MKHCFYHHHNTRLGVHLSGIWHYNIPQYLSEEIEKIQKRPGIFRIMEPSLSYRASRELTGLHYLTQEAGTYVTNFCEELPGVSKKVSVFDLT